MAKHSRFVKLPKKPHDGCDKKCPRTGNNLEIVIFVDDLQIRSHAIDHCIHPKDITEWKKIYNIDNTKLQNISNINSTLNKLGCPGLTIVGKTKPYCKGCYLYNNCTDHVKELIDIYNECIKKVLEKGLNKPRFVCYTSKGKALNFVTIPDFSIVARARYIHNKHYYNLTTCYPKNFLNLAAFIKKQLEKIEKEIDNKKEDHWCVQDNWHFLAGSTPSGFGSCYSRKSNNMRSYIKNRLEDF